MTNQITREHRHSGSHARFSAVRSVAGWRVALPAPGTGLVT